MNILLLCLDKHLGGKGMGHMVVACLTFKKTAKLFSEVMESFSFPLAVHEFHFLYFLTNTWCDQTFQPFSRCAVISCIFNFHWTDTDKVQQVATHVSLSKNSFQIFLPIFLIFKHFLSFEFFMCYKHKSFQIHYLQIFSSNVLLSFHNLNNITEQKF